MTNPRDYINAYLDEALPSEQMAELEAWLMADRANMETFVRLSIISRHIHEMLTQRDLAQMMAIPHDDELDGEAESPLWEALDLEERARESRALAARELEDRRRREAKSRQQAVHEPCAPALTTVRHIVIPKWIAYGMVAAMLALAALLAIEVFRPRTTPATPQIASTPVVAHVRQIIDAQLKDGPVTVGDELRQGSQQLLKGFLKIELVDGAVVIVEAPCTFALESDRVDLTFGRIVGFCPPHAKGLSIRTPSALITDLGTEFGVEVGDDQQTSTRVFSGEVELVGMANGHAATPVQNLVEGQAARVDRTGTQIAQVDAQSLAFMRETELDVHERIAQLLTRSSGLLHRWTFNDGSARDVVGSAHGTLMGGAFIRDGVLQLQQQGGYLHTESLDQTLRAKTLAVRVRLANLEQHQGGVLTVEHRIEGNPFDGIVFGEYHPGHWVASSENGNRTNKTTPLGARELEADRQFVVLVLTFGPNGDVAMYRNGTLYGEHRSQTTYRFPADESGVLIGLRHSDVDDFEGQRRIDAFLTGEVDEAMVFNRALDDDEVRALSIYMSAPRHVVE